MVDGEEHSSSKYNYVISGIMLSLWVLSVLSSLAPLDCTTTQANYGRTERDSLKCSPVHILIIKT